MARLLLHGYIARLGPASMEPAGFCALLPYPDDHAAELTGLLTITRYQGEGSAALSGGTGTGSIPAGSDVRVCLYHPGRCPTAVCPAGIPERCTEAVAAEKWHGYDPARRAQVAVYRRDLTPDTALYPPRQGRILAEEP